MKKNQIPKVLVISHNVFSRTGAMGKTMASLLSCIPPDHMAQLYIHSEVPTTGNSDRYFRITDRDVLRSIFTRRPGFHIYSREDIDVSRVNPRTDSGAAARIYQFSRRRTAPIYFMRNALWRIGIWKSKALYEWIEDFSPDVIFFASGDYSFSYRITYEISRKYQLPVVMWCCDDFYFSRRFRGGLTSRLYHQGMMGWIRRLNRSIDSVIVISDRMAHDYRKIFAKPIYTIRISADQNRKGLPFSERSRILYAGGLGVNRIRPLLKIGRALKKAGIPGYDRVHVYTGDRNPETLSLLTEDNGIICHGMASPEELEEILGAARYVLHIEASDVASVNRTRYSLSTKIGESLRSGACILACGPRDIASMQYLRVNSAALMPDRAADIPGLIRRINGDESLYLHYVNAAAALAEKNHNKEKNDAAMRKILQHAAFRTARKYKP